MDKPTFNTFKAMSQSSKTANSTLGKIRAEVIQISSQATVGIQCAGIIPKIGHGKTEESTKRSYKDDLGLQGFEQ